ncbi:uncharacterized protein LOC123505115 [Portunus trituberculatus]|uniref:uncharacterized protein LOC123505115 n=1 Tax=Portunus trituberculatus TaxID=210409 RepID=UPI001E1CED00|nr:uncharacterized protein LOC123505115 [Portunus trituberculatus]
MKPEGEANGVVVGNGCVPGKSEENMKLRDDIGCERQLISASASARFREMLEGLNVPGDSGNPPVAPPWLDKVLFNKGRQFYQRYFFCVFMSDLVSLLMLFTVNRILRPLMYTGRSDTALKALRRYVSTISHVIAWYSGDMWDPADPAHKDIMQVRQIHKAAAKTFNSPTHVQKVDAASITTTAAAAASECACPFAAPLMQDLHAHHDTGVELEAKNTLYISQWDQLFTQYGFLGVMVAHPWRMGAWRVTDEEMAGFIHFWRGAGWLLGIEDKYNFCNGTVEETRALCKEMEDHVVKPCLSRAGRDHEIMGTALIDGLSTVVPFFSYPAVLRLLGDVLEVPMPAVTARMSGRQRFHYVFIRVVLHGLFLVPGVVWVFNEMLKAGLKAVQGKHSWWKTTHKVTPYSY